MGDLRGLQEQLDMQDHELRQPIFPQPKPKKGQPILPSLYRSKFGQNSVSYEVTPRNQLRTFSQSDIDHPNVLKHLGSTSISSTQTHQGHVYTRVDLNLRQLHAISPLVTHYYNSKKRLIHVTEQLTNSLHGLKEDNHDAHGKLRLNNVGIQLFPDPGGAEITRGMLKNSQIVVQLLNYTGLQGSNQSYIDDLRALGEEVLGPLFTHAKGDIRGAEMQDFLLRIDHVKHAGYRNSFSTTELDKLQKRFREDYLYSPKEIMKHSLFQLDGKCEAFVCQVDELINKVYTCPSHAKGNKPPLLPGIGDFITSVKKLDSHVYDWMRKLYNKMWTDGCKFTNYRYSGERGGVIGLLNCMRNVITHWDRYDQTDREAISNLCGTIVENHCYPFFQHFFPRLVVHLYGCIELHYRELNNALPSTFKWDFKDFVSSRAR